MMTCQSALRVECKLEIVANLEEGVLDRQIAKKYY